MMLRFTGSRREVLDLRNLLDGGTPYTNAASWLAVVIVSTRLHP